MSLCPAIPVVEGGVFLDLWGQKEPGLLKAYIAPHHVGCFIGELGGVFLDLCPENGSCLDEMSLCPAIRVVGGGVFLDLSHPKGSFFAGTALRPASGLCGRGFPRPLA